MQQRLHRPLLKLTPRLKPRLTPICEDDTIEQMSTPLALELAYTCNIIFDVVCSYLQAFAKATANAYTQGPKYIIINVPLACPPVSRPCDLENEVFDLLPAKQ